MATSAYGPVFVVGGIGEINADMPQANACANCLGPTANKRYNILSQSSWPITTDNSIMFPT